MDQNVALYLYCLRLGDNSLILGHRLSEWCGHGPFLEEDIAMTNISLDLVGQSRMLLQYAAELSGNGTTENTLAYLRDERDFLNALLSEQPNGDFAVTNTKNYLFSVYNYHLYAELSNSKDEKLKAIAEKSIKEVAYHVRHCGKWMLRLGKGTEESHKRLQEAVNDIWMFTEDLFESDESTASLIEQGIAANPETVRHNWLSDVTDQLKEATIEIPTNTWMMKGSLQGKHSEHLGYLLAEMQTIPRTFPNSEW
ncbi:MAG TPA: phenylacetate-CoA oxygenase subunit PaaI [Flavobacteriales bacterium]|nr:phenylacetate-CoA oxygenase subunit PaaI [Flavobacteriales bacterium]